MNAATTHLTSYASPPLERPLAHGAYDLLVTLGSGGMGDVFLASRRGRDGFRKMCVVKKLRPGLETDETFRTMFSREARIAARMNHPNVVSTDEIGEHEGALYLAMEYLEGQTLRSLIGEVVATGLSIDPLVWVTIMCEVLEGLQYIHELKDFDGSDLGVVHGDVSPHNVCLTYDGRVALIDFGSAVVTREAAVDRDFVTGKLGYMAPECVAGKDLDRRSDIYSAGIVLWELLAGMRVPREGAPTGKRPRAVPPLSAVMEEVAPELEAIVARAVAIDPRRRYPTAAAMRRALESYVESTRRSPRRSVIADILTSIYGHERVELETLARKEIAKIEMSSSGIRAVRDPIESISDQMTTFYDRAQLPIFNSAAAPAAVSAPAQLAAHAPHAGPPSLTVDTRSPWPSSHPRAVANLDDVDVFLGSLAKPRPHRVLAMIIAGAMVLLALLVALQMHFGG